MAGLQSPVRDSETLLKECEELEGDLAGLKVAYEQYFLGLERKAPAAQHRELGRKVLALKGCFTSSTQARFRIGTLSQKLQTYERMWERTLNEMEAGTYRRDVFKAKLHAKPAKKEELAPGPVAPVPPTPPPSKGGDISEAKVKALFSAYVTAKKRCNEDTSKLTLEGLQASLKKQVPEIRKKHGGRDSEFKVVIKDGRAQLRAVPVESAK